MLLVRAFDDALSGMAREEGCLPGIQILSSGQEGIVAVLQALNESDVLVSNHRSHAHLLARGGDPNSLMAEIMAKATGVNQGKSGTLHLIDPEVNALMTSTVVGAGPPMSVGAAFAQHYRREEGITVVIFGDGAAAEGSVHEALNLAAAWKLPLLFVCENNHWAGAQRLEVHLAGGSVANRAPGYGIPGETVDGNDPDAVFQATKRLASRIREGGGPALLEAVTYRMHGHSEADPQKYVDPTELEEWSRRDPIENYTRTLLSDGSLTPGQVDGLRAEARQQVDAAVSFATQSPDPRPEKALEHLWAEPVEEGPPSGDDVPPGRQVPGGEDADPGEDVARGPDPGPGQAPAVQTVFGGQAVQDALATAMAQDERVFLAGEGVGTSIHPSPMGPTHGLLDRFGKERVRDTPVSEAAIAGLAVGAATMGLLPVVEVMFFPFFTLASDMLVNHAAKLRFLSGGKTPVPLTVRVKGGRVQAGCQHSHNLEAWIAHAPGLKLVWGSNPADMKGLLLSAIFDPDPVIVVEDMALYWRKGEMPEGDVRVPLGRAAIAREGSDVTVATYGMGVHTALQAAETLGEEGISLEVLDLRTLVPLDKEAVLQSVSHTGRFVALHEANRFCGYGAELAAVVAEEGYGDLKAPVRRVAAPDIPVPFAPSQEAFSRPGPQKLMATVRSML
jgi:2-oxoisovalerate dehydrogenase E1 component